MTPIRFPATRRGALRYAAAGIAAAFAVYVAPMLVKARRGAVLARASEPFQRLEGDAPSATLVVIGDSTAVGTGAELPSRSVTGRIAARHPTLAVANRAVDGARLADLPAQLAGIDRVDAVLIQAGGNDVLRLTAPADVAAALDATLRRAKSVAATVVLMPAGNVGAAPFFPWPLSRWMTWRARRQREALRRGAARHGVVFVDLWREVEDDPFLADPWRFYARDGLHLTGAGYAQWDQELQRQSRLDAVLTGAASRSDPPTA